MGIVKRIKGLVKRGLNRGRGALQKEPWYEPGSEAEFRYDADYVYRFTTEIRDNMSHFRVITRNDVQLARVNERVVENPLVFKYLGGEPRTVLDIGGTGSLLSFQLAHVGHTVTVCDVRPYPFHHPRLKFVQADAMTLPFADGSFDCVTAISSIEHFGLGGYGDPRGEKGQLKVAREIRRVCRPGGKALVSVPYGSGADPELARKWNYVLFDEPLLADFARHFERSELLYFVHDAGAWIAADAPTIHRRSVQDYMLSGIAFMVLHVGAPT